MFNSKREDRTTELAVSSTHVVTDDTSGSQYQIRTKSGEINNIKNPESIKLSIYRETDAISGFGRRYTTSVLRSCNQRSSPTQARLLRSAYQTLEEMSCRVYRETNMLQGFDGEFPLSELRLPE